MVSQKSNLPITSTFYRPFYPQSFAICLCLPIPSILFLSLPSWRSPRMSHLLLPGLPGWLHSGSILLAPLEQPKFHSCHLLFPAVLPWLFQPKSSPPSTRLSWLVPLLLAPRLHSLLSSQLLLQSFPRDLTSLHGLRCHSR